MASPADSATFHVPSVPRALLLPGLDTHEVRDEDLPDPTPPGSHWLFQPPPFISWADLRSETVTISNPAALRNASLGGYTLSDRQKRHTYSFSSGCKIPARGSVTLHCCPGRLSNGEVDALPKSALLWTNQDGSLRRKEVLDNEGDAVVLSDARGKEVASLDLLPGEGLDGSCTGEAYMNLPGVKRSQVLALRTLALTLCYVRLVLIGVAACWVTVNPDVFLLAAVAAHGVDVLCRWASSQPGVPMDDFGVVLATMGDRFYGLVLVGSLVLLDEDKRHGQLFAGMLVLDIMANWLQLSVASAAGGSRSLAGGVFVKGAAPDFATHLMLRHPVALTLVSLGNEAFLMWCYLVASSDLPLGLKSLVSDALCFLARWLYFMEEQSYCEEITPGGVFAGYQQQEISFPAGNVLGLGEGEDGVSMAAEEAASWSEWSEGDGTAASVMWKAMWMSLMLCCAVRQLLSCIQALISLSTLSSGVIADAAGQDMQRCTAHGGRGRTAARANGGGGGGAGGGSGNRGLVSRARSRSRVR